MKHIRILCFLSLFAIPLIGIGQWVPIATIPCSNDCNSSPLCYGISFISPQAAYRFISRGECSPTSLAYFEISRTLNSFTSWNGVAGCGQYGAYLLDADVVSEDTMYLYSQCLQTYFERTTDGGGSWTQFSTVRPEKMVFVNGELGYGFIGQDFYRFYMDSLHFVATDTVFYSPFYDLYFADSLTGYVFFRDNPNQFYLFDYMTRTIDGGLTWSDVHLDTARTFYSTLNILNDSVAFLLADSGYVYKTIDRGNAWTIALKNDSIGGIQFISEEKVFGIQYDSINTYYCYSADFGLNWSRVIIPVSGNEYILKIKMFNDSVGYINLLNHDSWHSNIILKTTNNGGIGIFSPENIAIQNLFIIPNPNHGDFFISIPPNAKYKDGLITIYNYSGEEIYRQKYYFSEAELHLKLQPAPRGVYCITLNTNTTHYTGKVIFE